MEHVLSIDDALQGAVGEALEQGGHGGLETHRGLGMFDELRREFPHATILTVNLMALLEALDEAVKSQDV